MSLETLKTKVGKLIEKAQSGGNTDELEAIIDNSGVLDSTEGTVEEKVEVLIENKKLWDLVFKNNAEKQAIFYRFEGDTIPQLDYTKMVNFRYFANFSSISHIDFYIDSASSKEFKDAFANTSNLKTMVGVNTSKATNVNGMFYKSAIEEIQEPLDLSSVISDNNSLCIQYAQHLKEVRLVPETLRFSTTIGSEVLSAESIQSIIDGLAIVTTAKTLTLNANLKILQSQVDSANAKGWTVAGGTVVSEEEYYG